MKNDLDFIKDKIENSGVNAPQDMDEAYIAKTLGGISPRPVPIPPKRRRKAVAIALSATAAALVLVISLGIILRVFVSGQKTTIVTLPGGLELKQFHTHDEVKKEVMNLREKEESSALFQRYEGGDVFVEDYYPADGDMAAENGSTGGSSGNSASGSSGSSAGGYDQSADSFSETYKQVDGVDEADIIKTDGRYIYCVDSDYSWKNKVIIFTADGQNSKKAAEIAVLDDDDSATGDEVDRWDYYPKSRDIVDLYLKDDRLVVICNDQSGYNESTVAMSFIKVYDVSDIDHITLLDTFTQSGRSRSSRMIGDILYLVSTYSPYRDDDLPICGRGDEPDELSADCIYSMADNDTASFLVLSAYDTLDHSAQAKSKSILGKVDDLYCNLDHMYIYATHYEQKWYDRFLIFEDEPSEDSVKTQILKVDLSGGITFSAYADVPGFVDDRYALDEYEGNLRIATTSTEGWQDTNNLFVLNDELRIIGSVNGFARNEQIKAVRYVGDTAYVITYEQTDPLFVIDLSVPTNPVILGEAKISGFSTMLVPIDQNTILGLGYHTSGGGFSQMELQDGFKLVLFDVSDKLQPKVLDTKVYENCSSAVQYDPKALVYNADRSDYIVPLNEDYWGEFDSATGEYVDDEYHRGGVLNFKVENDKLVEIGRYQSDHESIDRCVYVGDTVYMTYRDAENDYELNIDSVKYKEP